MKAARFFGGKDILACGTRMQTCSKAMSRHALQVVCALVFYDDQLLATRRDPSRTFPLKWEFPGGKLEDGESLEAALHRELEEELELKVRIAEALEPVRFRDNGNCIDLIPFACLPDQRHAPRPIDHVEIRWLGPDEAASLDWAPADVPLLEQLPGLFARMRH